MLQLVQPPEIPAITQSATTEDAAAKAKSSNGISASGQTQALPKGVLATPTPAETFAPESSSLLETQKSAALLGPPISVGYSVQPAEAAPVPESGNTSQAPSDRELEVKRTESASNQSGFTEIKQESSVSPEGDKAPPDTQIKPQPPIPSPQSPVPSPQSPVPNPQSPVPSLQPPIPSLRKL